MNKYEVIKSIMNSEKINENDKVYYIEMYIKKWFTEDDINWIWK